MAFQDDAHRWSSKVHLGKVRTPALVGAACAALLIVAIGGIGVARAFSTDGYLVTKDEAVAASDSEGASAAPEEEEPLARLCVFVSGEVAHPAVYYLDEGSRVADAVAAAGGFTDGAATDALNLARTLVDGEQVAVPAQGSAEASPSAAPSDGGSGVTASASKAAAGTGRVNINTADAAALQTLNGVGEATAKKIVADREANGPFKTIEDLKRVSGIGDKKFENLRDSICV